MKHLKRINENEKTVYRIKVFYKTGNSFGSHDTSDIIELEWKDLKVAERNLKYIKEHNEQYNQISNSGSRYYQKSIKDILDDNINKDWFVYIDKLVAVNPDNENDYQAIDKVGIERYQKKGWIIEKIPNHDMAQNCIVLYTDTGNTFQFWCPWCGYFETFRNAKIITNDETDEEF